MTGYDFDLREFMETGRRSWVLKRALNNAMGVTAADDRLPKRILTALTEGGAAGSVPDEKRMKSEYYRIRGLDENGFPTDEILNELGLSFANVRRIR